jgi:hypothetical protein
MKLPLLDVGGSATDDQLTVVKRELTPEDCEHYEKIGWKYFRETDLIDRFLPSLGEAIYFSGRHSLSRGIVVEIRGIRYLVQFEDLQLGDVYEARGKSLILTETDAPLSVPDVKAEPKWRGAYDYKFFGQPTWVQNSWYPTDARGNSCYHFLTIENDWGDAGNFNILLGIKDDSPSEAYFEASCC